MNAIDLILAFLVAAGIVYAAYEIKKNNPKEV
jgi:hypothetical protein